MKQFIALLLIIMCFSLVACNNTDDSNDKAENIVQTEEGNEQTVNNKENQSINTSDLPGVLKVNVTTVQYCVNTPFTLQKRAGTGYMFKDDQIAAIYDHYLGGTTSEKYDVNLDNITSADQVLEGMKNQVINACSDALIRADEITFEIDSKDNKTVNGTEMCRYEGRFVLNHKYPLEYNEAQFVAYGLIKDSCPIYFVVLDISSKQNIDTIGDTADKIAKTFREYSED